VHEYADDDFLAKDYDPRLMRRFLGYVRPYAPLVAVTFVFLAVRIAADLAGPLLFKRAVDGPLLQGDYAGLATYGALLGAAALATGLFEFLYSWVTNLVGQNVLFDLRMQLYAHLQKLSPAFFDRTSVGRLVVRVTHDVENLNELFTSGLVEFAADVLMLGGVVVMMFVVDTRLALVTLAVAPVVLAATLLFRRAARERYREMRRRIARLNGTLNENLGGMRTIQTFGRETTCLERFRGINGEYRDSAIGAVFAYSLFYPGIEVLSAAGLAVVVAYGGLSILDGTLTYGTLVAFLYLVHKFFLPVRELAEKYNILQSAMASSERIFQILDTPPQAADRPGARPAPPLRGHIEFDRVSFSYDGRTPVLRDVSFRVEPGKTLAIVGLTGAGKTTILNLLLRFYEPTSGAIRVDGYDVRELQAKSLRRQMGLVLQDVFLFAGTVEDNLRLGDPSITRERIEEAARAVHADRLIRRLPRGYETPVLERGAALSVGERQLLSFARALAFDPRILILDEATSSVDAETEQIVQQGLLQLLEGRTSIVIAHRLSTIQHADRILVLHRGQVREEGTHAELLRRDGLYRKLYRLQHGPARKEPEDGLGGVRPAMEVP
jgi:ATP-binding cassette subfamily B protein